MVSCFDQALKILSNIAPNILYNAMLAKAAKLLSADGSVDHWIAAAAMIATSLSLS
jgi:hypothetical protein